ncbi:MAG: YfbU family protein [Aestuariivirga sp.]|nr:YfbU family protein [Aestuariivirga sp.]
MTTDSAVVLRLDGDLLSELDEWISSQPSLLSREQAAHRLIKVGLGSDSPIGPRISDGERLIIAMMADLMKASGVKGDIDPDFVSSVVHDGHFWALEWKYDSLFPGQAVLVAAAEEVAEILEMWDQMITGFDQLSPPDKQAVEAKNGSALVSFPGFDGNNETIQYGIAKLLVEKMDRFKHVKGATRNSHAPVLEGYRRMLKVYRFMKDRNGRSPLTRHQILELMELS